MKLKKVLALTIVATMAVGAFVGCGSKGEGKSAKSDAGKVYYLNFKPEADEAWQALAKEYTKETGVNVTVVTAASNKYEETLMTEMSKSEAPTLFHVNGPVGLKNWKDYALDLSDTDVYKKLNGDEYALKEGDAAAEAIVQEFSAYLGRALAVFACVVDPEVIVVGGGVSKAGQILIDGVAKYYREAAFIACKDTPIVLASLGNDAGIYGAAKMLID